MKYIVANWKMNLGIRESVAMAHAAMATLQGKDVAPQVIICPSATALHEVRKTTLRSRVALGAQNAGPGRSGPFTGEVGLAQLEDLGVSYALLGHAERRALGEDLPLIALRLKELYAHSLLTPILCVSMNWREELRDLLKGLQVPLHRRLLVALEPTEAIGTGEPLSPAEAAAELKELSLTIRETLRLSEGSLFCLYGGSVSGQNAYRYLREPDIHGVLVGSVSLKAQEFRQVVDAATDVLLSQSPRV